MPNASYEKGLFERKLQELGLAGDFSRQVLHGLARLLHAGRTARQPSVAPRNSSGARDQANRRAWPEKS